MARFVQRGAGTKKNFVCAQKILSELICLIVKTILQEDMMEVTSEMLSVGDKDFLQSPVEMEGLVDRMREGWKVWKKKGKYKYKASFEAFAKYL